LTARQHIIGKTPRRNLRRSLTDSEWKARPNLRPNLTGCYSRPPVNHDITMSRTAHQTKNRHLQNLEVDREGINSLAAWQSLDDDKESLIYRKFGYLSARRSLHLQNKVLDLEDQLEDLDAAVRQGDTEAKKSLRKHELFEQRSTSMNSIDAQRMMLLDKIDVALDKYRMCL
jgi:hypothetical protein